MARRKQAALSVLPGTSESSEETAETEGGEAQNRQGRMPRGVAFPAPLPARDREPRVPRLGGANPLREQPEREQPRPTVYLPPAPSAKPKRSYGVLISFMLCVVLPVVGAAIYFGKIASNQYVAEFRFAVKDTSVNPAVGGTNLLSLLGGSSSSSSGDNYLVTDYLSSRTAAEELQNRIKIIEMYSRPEIDWWSRFDSSKPMERFIQYWQKRITTNYDQVTGLATAQVRAFTPNDAYLISTTLVQLSEELINRIATRSQNDAVKFAEKEVTKAEERLKAIRARLTEFRNRVGVIDPTASVVASNSVLAQTLRSGLAQLETSLSTLQQRRLSATAPAIMSLQSQIKATKEQLAYLESNVGQAPSGASLSKVVGEYEQLDLERQFSQTMLTTALQALDQARANAAAQHLYITPYVRPSKPESSVYPERYLSVFLAALLAFMLWTIGLLVVRSIREHFI